MSYRPDRAAFIVLGRAPTNEAERLRALLMGGLPDDTPDSLYAQVTEHRLGDTYESAEGEGFRPPTTAAWAKLCSTVRLSSSPVLSPPKSYGEYAEKLQSAGVDTVAHGPALYYAMTALCDHGEHADLVRQLTGVSAERAATVARLAAAYRSDLAKKEQLVWDTVAFIDAVEGPPVTSAPPPSRLDERLRTAAAAADLRAFVPSREVGAPATDAREAGSESEGVEEDEPPLPPSPSPPRAPDTVVMTTRDAAAPSVRRREWREAATGAPYFWKTDLPREEGRPPLASAELALLKRQLGISAAASSDMTLLLATGSKLCPESLESGTLRRCAAFTHLPPSKLAALSAESQSGVLYDPSTWAGMMAGFSAEAAAAMVAHPAARSVLAELQPDKFAHRCTDPRDQLYCLFALGQPNSHALIRARTRAFNDADLDRIARAAAVVDSPATDWDGVLRSGLEATLSHYISRTE